MHDDDGAARPRGAAHEHLEPETGRLEEQLILLVQRTRTIWRDAGAAVHPDVPPIGYRLLIQLVKHGPSNPGRLADLLETDKSVVSRQARALEELGLVVVEPDPADGRGRLLQATEAACATVAETRRRARLQLGKGLDLLGPEEVERFTDLLERVNDGIVRA